MVMVRNLNPKNSKPRKVQKSRNHYQLRVNFSLKKEVFFVTIGSIVGAFTMFAPRMLMDATIGTQYYIAWLVFARTLDSSSIEVGVVLHVLVATIIGIVTGIILHKGKIMNISKISRGVLFGLIAGIAAFAVFFVPVQQILLGPNLVQVLTELDPDMTIIEAEQVIEEGFSSTLIDSVFTHLIWGLTVGILSSLLTRNFGADYRCHRCDIQFSKIDTYNHHAKYVHEALSPSLKRILILGGGYGGVGVLREIQSAFEDNIDVDITMVSEDNFFLFTPMLPEISTGLLEPRHIATPVRTFCKRARFFESGVDSINLKKKRVTIKRNYDKKKKTLDYDYLVLALGSKTNFFGNKNIEKHSLTIKTLGDAIGIRNHIITMLENADQEDDPLLRSKFMTFVVVGGGFSGVETAGELNDFVRESAEKFYRNLDDEEIRVVLVSAGEGILPEIGDALGRFAFESLKKAGVDIITSTKVANAGKDFVTLDNKKKIPSMTLIWAGGVGMDPVIANLDCSHDKRDRIIVDKQLRVKNYPNVFALGDCASVIDENSGKPYPPTAQHAIREAKVVSKNLISLIDGKDQLESFLYKTKGSMAKIGKRNGVALLMGHKIHGFLAWFIWRQFYLSNLPTREKKIRVAFDWLINLFFEPDITRLRNLKEKSLMSDN